MPSSFGLSSRCRSSLSRVALGFQAPGGPAHAHLVRRRSLLLPRATRLPLPSHAGPVPEAASLSLESQLQCYLLSPPSSNLLPGSGLQPATPSPLLPGSSRLGSDSFCRPGRLCSSVPPGPSPAPWLPSELSLSSTPEPRRFPLQPPCHDGCPGPVAGQLSHVRGHHSTGVQEGCCDHPISLYQQIKPVHQTSAHR